MCKKVVKLLELEHHICYAHTIHLGIVENIYSKIALCQDVKFEIDDNDELEYSCESWDSEEMQTLEPLQMESFDCIGSCIMRVRKIVKLFKKSTTRNDTLQENVVAKIGRAASRDIVMWYG